MAAHSEPKENRRQERHQHIMRQDRIHLQRRDMPSRRTRLREFLQSADLPDDLGLFAGTLIFPTGSNLPSVFSMPVYRLRMEFARAWKRIKDVASIIAFKYYSGWRKTKIGFRQTAPTAMALHRQIYGAFAEGDESTIRDVATDGVREKLIGRMQMRPKGTSFAWDLIRYRGQPRVVSHRASNLPIEGEDDEQPSGVRQAVVRIRSVQRLTREEDMEDEKDATEPEQTEKEVTEYVVIQKRVLRGKQEPWKFWGTTEETTTENFDEALHAAKASKALSRQGNA